MKTGRWALAGFAGFLVIVSGLAAEEPNEKAVRYHGILVERPSGGYLFDRFHNAWLESGTLDGLEEFLVARAAAEDAKIGDRLLLAYFFAKQGEDGRALEVFDNVLADGNGTAEAWLEKARIRARTLAFDEAISDLDAADAAEPKPETAIEIGKLRGRLFLRSGKADEALAAWRQLLADFPDDEELHEDLIELQASEGAIEEAVESAAALIEKTTDSYLKVMRQLRLGDLHQRAGDRETAIQTYSESLNASGLGTWLEKEILSQIERLFRRDDDLSGLKTYLGELAGEHPQRVALFRRQARVLAELGEADEAIETFREILRLTPGDRANREAFVDLLGRLERFDEAAEQMRALVELHPEDVELLAQLAVRQHAANQAEDAEQTVRAYLEKSDESEYAHLRAARLLERFERGDAAAEIFEKMVESFPDSVGAREAQAAFLHRSGKTVEAYEIWKSIAANGSGEDAVRAARALSSRGEREAAFEILAARVDEFQADFLFLGQLCAEATAVEKNEEALPWVERRLALAESANQLNEVIRQAVVISKRIEDPEAWRESLLSRENRSVAESCLLAELLERSGDFEGAEEALKPDLEAGNSLAIAQQVRLFEFRDLWERAAATQQLLVQSPDGKNSTNLRKLVDLHRRALNYEDALRWIEAWKQLSPGSSSSWREEANILVQADRLSEAIETLRRAAQRFEDDVDLRSQLATLYKSNGKSNDAERIYWTLFEESEDLDSKIQWVTSLAQLASSRDRQDRLIEQFEERRRNNRTSIAPLFALAEVYRQLDDYEKRRQVLLEATRLRPEDLKLLHQIARIEEEEGEWEQSLETLERAAALDPTTDTRRRIARLHLLWGDQELGWRQLFELAGGDEMDADEVLGMGDSLVAMADWLRVSEFLSPHLDRFPKDFRLVYLNGVALFEAGEIEAARDHFLRLLDWEHDLPNQPPAASTAVATASSYNSWYGEIPEGAMRLLTSRGYLYYARYHRQLLQSWRQGSSASSFYSSFSGGRFVRLPKTKEEARAYALSQLRFWAKEVAPVDGDDLAERMAARGVAEAELILALPVSDFFRGGDPQFPAELLVEENPDHLGLAILAVVWQMSPIQINPQQIDRELMEFCYDLLAEKVPHTAFAAALYAAASEGRTDGDGAKLLDRALKELPEIEVPPQHLKFVISTSLGGRYGSSTGPLLLDRHLEPLVERLLRWREAELAEAKRSGGQAGGGFSPYDDICSALRGSAKVGEFLKHLDSEIARYEETNRGSGVPDYATMRSYYSWQIRQLPLVSSFAFPPFELPDFPANVLTQFVAMDDVQSRKNLDKAKLKAAVDSVSNPILKVMCLDAAGEDSRVKELIEQLLNGEHGPAGVRERILAAAYFGKEGEPGRAARILDEVRMQPMSKTLRQRVDAAIASYAMDVKDDEAAFEAGKQAALRLRFGVATAEERIEVAHALKEFGLAEEAKKLEEKAAKTAMSRPSSRTVASPRETERTEIAELVRRGETDEAAKRLLKVLRPAARQMTQSAGLVQIDYDIVNFVRMTNAASIADEIFDEAGEPNSIPQSLERGALLELLGRPREAIEVYEAALDEAPLKFQGAALRLVVLQCCFDAEAGVERLLEQDWKRVGKLFPAMFDQIHDYLDNFRSSEISSGAAKLEVARAAALWLERADEEMVNRAEAVWTYWPAMHDIQNVIRFDGMTLPDLYLDPGRIDRAYFNRNPAALDAMERRRTIHDRLALAMLRSPQLARAAFRDLSRLALADDPGSEELRKLEEAAEEAVRQHSNKPAFRSQIPETHVSTDSRWRTSWYPEEFLIMRWATSGQQDGRRKARQLLEQVDSWNDGKVRRSAEAFFVLHFGEPAEFIEAANSYLDVDGSAQQHQGSVDPDQQSRDVKVFDAWQARRDVLTIEFGEFVAARFKRNLSRQRPAPLLADDYLVYLFETVGRDEAHRFLEKLTELALGPRERWGEFVRNRDRMSAHRFSYSGGYENNVQVEFAAFLTRVGWRAESAFLIAGFVRENGLNSDRQISNGILTANLRHDPVRDDFELMKQLVLGAASEQAEGLNLFDPDGNEQFPLIDLLNGIRSEARTEVVSLLEKKEGFGVGLMRAALRNKQAIVDFLGENEAQISAMDPEQVEELGTFVSSYLPNFKWDLELSDDSRAVLEMLVEAEFLQAMISVSQFLEAETVEEVGASRGSDFNPIVFSHLHNLVASGKFERAAEVFWHAVDLAAKRQASGNWDSHWNGWTYAADLLLDFNDDNPSRGGLERLGFLVHLLHGEAGEERLPHSAWQGSYAFSRRLDEAFRAAGGPRRLDEALTAVFRQLHEHVGDRPSSILFAPFYDFTAKLPRNRRVAAVAWADANRKGQPWSNLANEFAMAARFFMAANVRVAGPDNVARIENLDAWRAHYLAALNSENLGLLWRISIGTLIAFKGPHLIDAETAHRAAELCAEAMNGKHVFNAWHLAQIVPAFLELDRDERWETTAVALSDGWKIANRNRQMSTSTGKKFQPVDDAITPFLGLHLKLGDEERLTHFFENWREEIDHSTRTFWMAVRFDSGDFPTARELLESRWDVFDVLDYKLTGTYFALRYSEDFDRQLLSFLETIDDEGTRYLAELQLRFSPDPAPERRAAAGKFDLKGKRVSELAKRFSAVNFEKPGVRDRVVFQLAASDPTTFPNQNAIRQAFESAGGFEVDEVLKPNASSSQVRDAIRIPVAHGLAQANRGDSTLLEEMVKQLAGAHSKDSYDRRVALESVGDRLVERLRKQGRNLKPEQIKGLIAPMQLLLAEPQGSEQFDDFVNVYAALLTLAAKSETDLSPWRDSLPAPRRSAIESAVRRKPQALWTIAQQATQALGTNPAELTTRKAIVLAMSGDPLVRKALTGKQRDIFRQIADKRILTIEEMLENREELIAAWERDGWARVELAGWLIENGRKDEAGELLGGLPDEKSKALESQVIELRKRL